MRRAHAGPAEPAVVPAARPVNARRVTIDQATAWNGPEGEHWAETDRRGRGVNAAVHRYLFDAAAIGAGDAVLDIGCGTGETTRIAARRARTGTAVGVDLSAPMVRRAREAAADEGLTNVRFDEGDAQVFPFPTDGFDVAISQFGIMFFADPVAAFANVRRALRPGGRLVFVCPREMKTCPWYTVPLTALLRHARPGVDVEVPESGMFSLARRERVVDVLTAAGFDHVAPEPVDVALSFGPDAATAAEFYLGGGPVRAVRENHPHLSEDEVRRVLTEALRPYERDGAVDITGGLWLVTATRAQRTDRR
jgi:SAM-dependent methyltransferase